MLPGSPALVGVTAHQQMLPVHFDASGNLTNIAATNALAFAVGLW